MRLFGRDLTREDALIAEIGVNHEGDIGVASCLLRLAAEAGADAVKFQSFTPERYAPATDPARLARVRTFALDETAHERLAAEATKLSVAFFWTPATEDWVPKVAALRSAIKIASGRPNIRASRRAAVATGKPARSTRSTRRSPGAGPKLGKLRSPIDSYLCIAFPPIRPPSKRQTYLSIPFLAQQYGCVVGYSNHVIGWEACAAVVAVGARVIEVHFTDRRDRREFRDHALSMEAEELRFLRRTIDRVATSLGNFGKARMPCEITNLVAVRKGVVAARDLPAGITLARDDLMFARPAREFSAGEIGTLVGRSLRTAVRFGELIPRNAID